MTRVTVTRELACSANAFWKLFLDSAFTTKLFENLGYASYEILEFKEDAHAVVRKARGQPVMDAPAVVQKLIGPSFGYVEEGRFDRSTETWTWTTIPSVLADRSKIGGVLRAEALGADCCRMTVDATVEVKMLGVGGMVEATGEKTMRTGWTKTADYFESWLKQN